MLTQAGKKPQRGFGGRITFYEKDETKPILVEGQLVVYAFDEAGREKSDNKPTRRYVFPAEQLPLRMSKSELGASYSFWLPWDDVGGPQTSVGLICRFEPKGGAVITSDQTHVQLPGTMPIAGANKNPDGTTKPPKVPEGVASKPAMPSLQTMQLERNARLANYEVPAGVSPQSGVVTADGYAGMLPAKRMTATTINLPASYQMPSAGSIVNQPIPAQPGRKSCHSFRSSKYGFLRRSLNRHRIWERSKRCRLPNLAGFNRRGSARFRAGRSRLPV